MFYRKTDTEILCETLIKLADKQERFNYKFGLKEKSPYTEAMHAVMGQIEKKLNLPSAQNIGSSIPNDAINKIHSETALSKNKEKTSPFKEKPKKKPQKYFNGLKPPIQVIHGHSNDPENKTIAEPGIVDSKPQENEKWTATPGHVELPDRRPVSPSVAIPEIKETVTPDNIDDLTAAISEAVEPNIKEEEPKNSYNFPTAPLN